MAELVAESTTQTQKMAGMPLEEFIRRYDTEGPFEIFDGQVIPKMPDSVAHHLLARAIFVMLYTYCVAHQAGEFSLALAALFGQPA